MVSSHSFPQLGSHEWRPTFTCHFFQTTRCSPGLKRWTMSLPLTSPPMSLSLALVSTPSGLLTPTPPIQLTTGSTPFDQKIFSSILGFPSWFWGTSTSTTPSRTPYGTSRSGKSRPRLPTSRKRQNPVSPSLIPLVSPQGFP